MSPRTTSFALTIALLCAAIVVAAGVTATTAAGAAQGDSFHFRLNKLDRKALNARRRAVRMHRRSERLRALSEDEGLRVTRLEGLLVEAEGDETRLHEALRARLLEQYYAGENADWAFLLASDSAGEVTDRASLLGAAQASDEALARDYAMTLDRLEDLRSALRSLRDRHGEQAMALDDRAQQQEGATLTARSAHITDNSKLRKGAGVDGTWYEVPDGWASMGMGMLPFFGGGIGGGWDGGSRTPPRPATPLQIMAVLSDRRIDVYAGGRQDIANGRIDGRVLDALRLLADQFGSVTATSLVTGHGVYTTSGNISMHSVGCAVDIGSLSGIVIQPSTQGVGSITERGVQMLSRLTGDLAPHQVISLYNYGGPSLAMSDHYDHIHLGYSC